MGAALASLRDRLTYANVLATLTLFVVLAGGTAIGANQIGKSSVGKKQLKANAVTAKKIRKNAVTTVKIKKGAVSAEKVKPASLGDAELATSVPFSRVVQEFRSSATVSLPNEGGGKFTTYPLNASYTQEAGRTDAYIGYADVTVSPSCVNREVVVFLLIDPPSTPELNVAALGSISGLGVITEPGSAAVTKRLNLGPYPGGGTRVAPSAPTPRNLVLGAKAKCGAGEGVTITGAGVDVIGVK